MMLEAADNQRTTNPKYVGLEGQAAGHPNHTDLKLTAGLIDLWKKSYLIRSPQMVGVKREGEDEDHHRFFFLID